MKTVFTALADECDAKAVWITEGGVARSETADLLFRAAIALRIEPTRDEIEAAMVAYDTVHDGGDNAHYRATRAALLAARQ